MGKKNKPNDLDALMGGPVDLGDMSAGFDLGGFDPGDMMDPTPDQVADPLADVPMTDDLAADSAAELGALEQAYRDRAKAEAVRFRQATDSEFWFAVVFKTREEKDEFLARYKLGDLGDKYLIGRELDKRIRPAEPGEKSKKKAKR